MEQSPQLDQAAIDRDKKDVMRYGIYSCVIMLAMVPAQFMNVFYTDTLLIPAVQVASILLIARVIDFIMSFFNGAIMEKVRFKTGKYVPWVQIAKYFIYTGNLLAFFPLPIPMALRFVLIIVGYLLVQIPTAFMTTSQYGALNIACGPNIDKRNQMALLGVRLGPLVTIFTSATTTPFRKFLGQTIGVQYQDFAIAVLYTAVYFVSSALLVGILKQYDKPATEEESAGHPSMNVSDMVRCVVTNDQFIVNMISTLMFFVGFLSPMQIVIYYYIYIMKDPDLLLMALGQTVTQVFALATAFIGPKIGLKLGRKKAMVLGQALTTVSSLAMMFFGQTSIYVFIGLNCLTGLATALYSVFGFSYLIDVAEYGYWKTGIDNRIVTQSLSNVPMKIANFIGGSLALYGLAAIGYQAGQPMDAVMTTKFMYLYGGVPFVCNAIATVVNLFFYKIDDAQAQLYAKENRERELAKAAKQ